MITLKKSVGKNAINQLLDLRKIQLALLELELLSPSNFLQECLEEHLLQKLHELKTKASTKQLPISKDFLALLEGSTKVMESMIPATLEAIFIFQKEIQKRANPDGRIDPNGKSLASLNKAHKKALKNLASSRSTSSGSTASTSTSTTTNLSRHFDLVKDGDKISFILRHGNQEKKKVLSIESARQFITKNYNWNGIVKLMKCTMEKAGLEYQVPTNLSGTRSDDSIIISDEAILQIVKLQAEHQIKRFGLKSSTVQKILNGVDAKPGNFFISKIIKKAANNIVFMNESDNKSLISIDNGTRIIVPNKEADELSYYFFFKNLVQARNGLWSDLKGVVNIVGLRRVVDHKERTQYNDTLAVCWIDDQSQFRVEMNIATTEPGNRKIYRQLGPQTITVVPGFHFTRQPAGRTRNVIIQGKNNSAFVWKQGDSTMNFHQGNNSLRYPGATKSKRDGWLKFHGVTDNMKLGIPSSNFDERALLEMNKVFSEIYLILSRYGNDRTQVPYKFMQSLTGQQEITVDGIANGKMTLRQGSKTKKIDLQKAKEWMVKFWFPKRKTGGRKQIVAILLAISEFSTDILKTWKKLSAKEIVAQITDEHMRKLVEKQIEYTALLNNVDGLAGRGFVKMIRGIRPTKAQAEIDKEKIDNLLNQLDNFPLRNVNSLKQRFKTGLSIHTDNNRTSVQDKTTFDKLNDIAIVENETVGTSSAGCQVIYDTEVFYTFWTKLLQRASDAGQLRWYYTLIDATKFKKSGIV